MRVLVTGSAGFIGFHLVQQLIASEIDVVGVDQLKASYGSDLCALRAKKLEGLQSRHYKFIKGSVADAQTLRALSVCGPYTHVVHLAAFPGIRLAEEEPGTYLENNVVALSRLLESDVFCNRPVFLSASSSSVYGDAGTSGPCSEEVAQRAERLGWYAETKWIGEQIVQGMALRMRIPSVAMRFFTVVGPLGRPDMAYGAFARLAQQRSPIPVFGSLHTARDYTHVEDVVPAIAALLVSPSLTTPGSPFFRAVNFGFGSPRTLQELLDGISRCLGLDLDLKFMPRPAADSAGTWSDSSRLRSLVSLPKPRPLEVALRDALSDPQWTLLTQ
jgi:UDP-glucuronate 4-epimerase